jgi:hypothetical protein
VILGADYGGYAIRVITLTARDEDVNFFNARGCGLEVSHGEREADNKMPVKHGVGLWAGG